MSYQYRAVEKFWRDFYRLTPSQKESVRRAWQIFKTDPFHSSLRAHEIRELSAKARHPIYSAVIERDLRVIFRVDGSWVTTLDVRHTQALSRVIGRLDERNGVALNSELRKC